MNYLHVGLGKTGTTFFYKMKFFLKLQKLKILNILKKKILLKSFLLQLYPIENLYIHTILKN